MDTESKMVKILTTGWFKLLLWLGAIALVFILALLVLWLEAGKNRPKLITGVNLYNQEVTLLINDKASMKLQPFATYSINYDQKGLVSLTIKDKDNKELARRTHELSHKSHITLDLWSADDYVKQCIIEAEVSDLFYPTALEASGVTDFKVLSDKMVKTYSHMTNYNLEYFLAPGTYNGHRLPQTYSSEGKVFGIYPIECSHIEDTAQVTKEINWWTNYNPEVQQALFQKELTKLNTLKNQLN